MGILELLHQAGQTHKLIEMTYYKEKENAVKQYLLEPYELRDEYFFGFDQAAGHIKKFFVSNIKEVTVTLDEFDPRWEVKL